MKRRTGKAVLFKPTDGVGYVASRLFHARLAELYVSTQFSIMGPEFCRRVFGMDYPPVSVCFSRNGWNRYLEVCRNESNE